LLGCQYSKNSVALGPIVDEKITNYVIYFIVKKESWEAQVLRQFASL